MNCKVPGSLSHKGIKSQKIVIKNSWWENKHNTTHLGVALYHCNGLPFWFSICLGMLGLCRRTNCIKFQVRKIPVRAIWIEHVAAVPYISEMWAGPEFYMCTCHNMLHNMLSYELWWLIPNRPMNIWIWKPVIVKWYHPKKLNILLICTFCSFFSYF